jgi:flagellar biosynthesis protein FlhF
MKVKSYIAANSREAMAQVKKELGSDAVILSNRAVSGGVEILALAQGDVAGLVTPAQAQRPAFAAQPAFESRRVAPKRTEPKPNVSASLKEFAQRLDQAAVAPVPQRPTASAVASGAKPAAPVPARTVERVSSADARLFAEIKAMRGDLEKQLAGLAWNEGARRRPLRAKLMREMLAAGLSAPLGRKVSAGLPDDYSEGEARKWLRAVLAKNIRCDSEEDNIVSRGGVYALVGPTGVGKTTTVAKLAARCVVRYGAHKLALVSTDSYRIGAQDQLGIYAKILGVQVHAAQDAAGLERVLASLSDRHMVLIDTVGMGQRDTRVAEQLALVGGKKVNRILLLNAASQLETLEDVIRVYKGSSELAGAIVTKLDESRRPGCVLDTVMRHKLNLAFVADGQRVPEDIHLPVAASLVDSALAAGVDSPFALDDDELMLMSDARPVKDS